MTPSNTREQTLFGKRRYSRLPERAMKRGSRFCPRLLRKLIVRGRVHEHADATHAVGLLSSNPERATSGRSTKPKADECVATSSVVGLLGKHELGCPARVRLRQAHNGEVLGLSTRTAASRSLRPV